MHAQVAAFVSRRWRVPRHRLRVDMRPLQGGLESVVTRAHLSGEGRGASMPSELVVKELRAGLEREAAVYELLWRHLEQPPAVRLLGRETRGDATFLYLENAPSSSSWPWADTECAAAVCRGLARLHDVAGLPHQEFSWDYEDQLARSAEATLQLAGTARDRHGRRCWARLGDLRRVVAALPALRDRLLASGTTVIHGDVHPGNVVLRPGDHDSPVVLLDWARARVGSPLEDVASWLHSLGCWEPQARRRHDTLMRAYLDARTVRRPFASDVRVDYWLASASNGLSGAIRYHLAVLGDGAATDAARYDSGRALAAWERVVRAAAAVISTSLARRT
jgi:aminoglycoside phosphotransferase (APT) family kinase protein